MAIEALEIRMAKLEGGYEQINERLGTIEQRLASFEQRLASFEQRFTSEITALRSETRVGDAELRKQMTGQFYWLLTFVLGSILVPILRDLARRTTGAISPSGAGSSPATD